VRRGKARRKRKARRGKAGVLLTLKRRMRRMRRTKKMTMKYRRSVAVKQRGKRKQSGQRKKGRQLLCKPSQTLWMRMFGVQTESSHSNSPKAVYHSEHKTDFERTTIRRSILLGARKI
jgi:hypothetical protein